MENNKTFIIKKITALAMALLMVFSAGFTPALAVEGEENEYIAAVGEALYESLQEAVDNAENEAVITLLSDANGDGVIVPEGKEITFDFSGYTYTVDGKLVGSAGTETLGFQLLKGAKVTLKNGTLKAGKAVKFLVQNYSDLTVEDMTLDVTGVDYQYAYALSNNCGDITVKGATNISSDYVAFDLWYNLQGAYPEGVTVTFDETFTGTVIGDIEYGAYAYEEGFTEKTALVIKGGTFEGEIVKSSAFEEKANITVYGGTFTDADVVEYCAQYHKAEEENGRYNVFPVYVAKDGKDNKYFTLQSAVDAAEDESVITLLSDANGDGVIVPEGKQITFDFGGYTYTVDGKLVGSAGTETLGLQLLKGAKVTLRNGTLKAGKAVKFLVQNYSDLTVEDMTLDVTGVDYQYAYALSNNCGNILVTGESNISSDYVAFDLWYNLQGGYPEGVRVIFDENYTGTVIGDIEYGAYAGMNTEGWTENVVLTIKNGTFEGEIVKSSAFEEKANITVYGGTFTDADVVEYCAQYHKAEEENGRYDVFPVYVAKDGNDKKYFTLQSAVDAAEDESVITLLSDANGDGMIVPEGKEITFDFGGYTYTVDGKLVGSAGTETLGFQLLKGAKVTLRNGTLKAGKAVKFLVQNYSDLTVEDMTLDVTGVDYQYAYALSNNCGDIAVKGATNISSDYVAFDLWYNLQGAYPEGVTVTFDETFTGTVIGDMEYGAYTGMNTEGWTEKVVLTIKNGTFEGDFVKSSSFEEKANITVYGGTFADGDVAEYCAEDFKAVADGEKFKVVPKDYIITSSNGKKYEKIQEAVDNAADGDTLTLLADAKGDGIFVTGDKNITFDFDGHTYTVDGELVGSNGTKSQAMHIEKGAKIILKDGALVAGGEVRMLVQNYCDLTLDNFDLDTNGKKIYALSNNCGNVLVTGDSDITSAAAAFDLWYNLQGGYPEGVSVTFDENYTGTVIGNIEYGAYAYEEGFTEKTALVIKGGTFEGEIVKSSSFEEKANITVCSGTFADEDVAEYCAEDFKAVADGEKFRVVPKDYIVITADGKKYEKIQKAVDNAADGDTLTLLSDANGDGIFVTGDKNITFDFDGHTYTVDGELVGSAGTETLGLQLLKGAKVTLKNGTLKAGKNVKFLVQNYADLNVDEMTLDVTGVDYQYAYALSNNCGNILVTGESNISSDYVAFDLWYNLQGAYPEGVSVTFDETFTGTVIGDIEYGAYAYEEGFTEKTVLVIKGGTFEGKIKNLNEKDIYAGDMNITLYGGIFTEKVLQQWCAEGSDAAEFDDGTYGPCFHDFTQKTEDRAHFCAAASCEKGNVYYYDCSRCEKISRDKTFDDGAKLGHSFSSHIYNNDATCTEDGTATAFCGNCNSSETIILKGSAKHGWGEWTVAKAATCTVNGTEERLCDVCGEREERQITAKHNYSSVFVTDVEAKCGKPGSKSRHCSYCDAKTDITSIPAKTHINKVTVTPATLKGPGYTTTTCTLCGNTSSVKIFRIKTVKLAKTTYTYTGKAFKPAVTVKDYNGKTLVNGKDYTVKYSNNKAIGKGKAVITFKGNYSGTKTLTFSINPAKVGSLKLTAKNDSMALSWKTVKGADGYQISYSTSKKFTKKTTKTTYIKKQKTKKATLKKLKDGKKYYVRIRAYKKVSGKNVFGAYSSVKNVKVK